MLCKRQCEVSWDIGECWRNSGMREERRGEGERSDDGVYMESGVFFEEEMLFQEMLLTYVKVCLREGELWRQQRAVAGCGLGG